MRDHKVEAETPAPSGAQSRAPPYLAASPLSDPPSASAGSAHGTSREAPAAVIHRAVPVPESAKWAWGVRRLSPSEILFDPRRSAVVPRPGDVAIVRVEKLGYHSSLVTRDNRKLRIYPGDFLVGVFGHRYATDAYEAVVEGTEELSLLTAAGMIGTVRSSHREMARATSVTFVGYATDVHGRRINLKERLFRPADPPVDPVEPLIVVVGTGMNSGKTTVLSQTLHGLSRQGLRVAAGKLTGSVSNRDPDEMWSAEAVSVLDFSDYGFPSTYLADPSELSALWHEILAQSAETRPDVLLMEIADGVLQRETAMILGDPEFRRRVTGVLLAADCSLSALGALAELRRLGYPVLGVSGAFTSAPLFVREFEARSEVPALSSTGAGAELALRVVDQLALPSWTAPSGPLAGRTESEPAPVTGVAPSFAR